MISLAIAAMIYLAFGAFLFWCWLYVLSYLFLFLTDGRKLYRTALENFHKLPDIIYSLIVFLEEGGIVILRDCFEIKTLMPRFINIAVGAVVSFFLFVLPGLGLLTVAAMIVLLLFDTLVKITYTYVCSLVSYELVTCGVILLVVISNLFIIDWIKHKYPKIEESGWFSIFYGVTLYSFVIALFSVKLYTPVPVCLAIAWICLGGLAAYVKGKNDT